VGRATGHNNLAYQPATKILVEANSSPKPGHNLPTVTGILAMFTPIGMEMFTSVTKMVTGLKGREINGSKLKGHLP
jgi:hypothetical protein